MFLLHCSSCGRRELRSTRAPLSFASTARGIEITIACSHCGADVHLRTGVRADALTPTAPATTATAPAPVAAARRTGSGSTVAA